MESVKRTIILSILLFGYAILVHGQRRPVIGISDFYRDGTNAAVSRTYVDAVLYGGGIPVVVPLIQDEDKLIELLNSLDGVIFTGGEDFDPAYYNETPIPQMGRVNAPRDAFDIKLLQLAAERSIPILGICRGVQLINIVFGGSLYQDLPAQYTNKSIKHRQTQPQSEASHSVIVEDQTVFADIVKERMLLVNSLHHQAIKKVAPGFRVAGKSPDQIVEVIEKVDDDHWIVGVQFHPEIRFLKDNAMRRIFQRFIEEAGSVDKPDRAVKMASVRRPEFARDSEEISSKDLVSERESVSKQPIIYQSVVDTQYIYKIVRDTQYVYVPADTVFLTASSVSVTDTIYIQRPTDTVYVSVPDIKTTLADVQMPDPPSAPVRISTDTMIYVPGALPSTNQSDSLKIKKKTEKREKKEQARKEQEQIKVTIKEKKEEQKANVRAEKEAKKAMKKADGNDKKAEKEKLKAAANAKKTEKKALKAEAKAKPKAEISVEEEKPKAPIDTTSVAVSKKEKAKLAKEAKKAKARADAVEVAKTKKEQEAAQMKAKLDKEAAKLQAKQAKENSKQEKKEAREAKKTKKAKKAQPVQEDEAKQENAEPEGNFQ